MKNKRIFLVFILSALFLFALAGTSKASNSINTGSESYSTFEFTTKIERWSQANDLVFVKNDSWSGDWYTKRVFLRGQYNGSDVEYEITANKLSSIDTYDGSYNHAVALKDKGPDGDWLFDLGSDVYLVEQYDVSSLANYYSNEHWTVGATDSSHSLSSSDRLVLDVNDSTITDTSFANYNPSSSDKTLYVEARYQSETPSSENRDLYLYVYMENNSEKTNEVDQGTINLPVYEVYVDFTAYGNCMPAGTFSAPSALSAPEWGSNNPTTSSNYGYYQGRALYNSNYSLITYRDIQSLDDDSITYSWSSNEHVVATNGGSSYSVSPDLSCTDYDTYYNEYTFTLSGTISANRSAPNGVFYNIIPFVVAGVIAVAGIIVFKKRSTK